MARSRDPKPEARPDSAQAAIEGRPPGEGRSPGTVEPGDRDSDAPQPSDRLPPAGPHADPSLMDPDATPGTGALTPAGGHDDIDSTSS